MDPASGARLPGVRVPGAAHARTHVPQRHPQVQALIGLCLALTRADALHLEPLPGMARGSSFGCVASGPGARLAEADGGALRAAVAAHRVVVLRQAFDPVGEDAAGSAAHVALAASLGDGGLDTRFAPHPRATNPAVFRVSNDPNFGHVGVGTSGWHCDGTFTLAPHAIQTMACVAAAPGADTSFVPFAELLRWVPRRVRKRWESLWLDTGRGIYHPLVHTRRADALASSRRRTGHLSMFFHGGPAFVRGYKQLGRGKPRRWPEHAVALGDCYDVDAAEVRAEIDHYIQESGLAYTHCWQPGDVLLHDNLGTAHLALPGTQGDPAEVGVRLMERCTVRGDVPLTAAAGGGFSFVDRGERRAYLEALWDSGARLGMSSAQQAELRAEIEGVGGDVR